MKWSSTTIEDLDAGSMAQTDITDMEIVVLQQVCY